MRLQGEWLSVSQRSDNSLIRMLCYRRMVVALGLSATLMVPALFEKMWMINKVIGIGITVANLPGILLAAAGRYLPPEGYPGRSPSAVS